MDKDGSGTIETSEFKHLMTHVGKKKILSSNKNKCENCSGDVLTESEVMMLINAADKDGDGSLDFEEFVKIMM